MLKDRKCSSLLFDSSAQGHFTKFLVLEASQAGFEPEDLCNKIPCL
jgi:hypothetical protein